MLNFVFNSLLGMALFEVFCWMRLGLAAVPARHRCSCVWRAAGILLPPGIRRGAMPASENREMKH